MTNPKFVKALDRRSRILSQTGHHEDALVDALSAAVIDKEKSPGLYEHVEELLVQISEIKAKEQYKVCFAHKYC